MSRSPMDKIREWTAEHALAELQMIHDFTTAESPIERLLITAVHAIAKHSSNAFYEGLMICGARSSDEFILKADMNEYALYCVPQMQEGPYRLDFAFFMCAAPGVVKRLAVECDGHDFHERTKDQAAKDRSRDRALQEQGYVVYRFTGREIYSDPMKCAGQIAKWANDVSYGNNGK